MPIDSSKFFDKIRVKPRAAEAAREAAREREARMCDAPGCTERGAHRAPKGRGVEKDYWHFCLNHVREYNQGYNFFEGMNADAVARYQKDALTGHRPTWKMGTGNAPGPELSPEAARDPFNVFRELGNSGNGRTADIPPAPPDHLRADPSEPWRWHRRVRYVRPTRGRGSLRPAHSDSCCSRASRR